MVSKSRQVPVKQKSKRASQLPGIPAGALIEDEPVISTFIDAVSALIVLLGSDGKIIRCNKSMAESTGYRIEEIQGKAFWDLMPVEEREAVQKLFKSTNEINTFEIYENYWISRDGSTHLIAWSSTRLNDERGSLKYILVSGIDITESRLTDRALKESLRELRDIKFALDQSAIVAITDQTGIIHYVNDKFCEISKYSRNELIGQDHRIINSGFHAKEFIRDLWRTIANGKVWKGELRNRAKDGSIYWVDTTIVPFMNAEGKPYQYVAIRADITERKRAELRLAIEHDVVKTLAETEDLNEALGKILQSLCEHMECTFAALYLISRDPETMLCYNVWISSPSLVKFEEQIRSRHFLRGEGIPGKVWESAAPFVLTRLTAADLDANVPHFSGADLKSAFGFPILFGNEVLGAINLFSNYPIHHDDALASMYRSIGSQIGQFIQRKTLEELAASSEKQIRHFEEKLKHAEKLMIMGMFASEIAHEVGTPLNIISGRVELLAEKAGKDERMVRDLNAINQQIERIAGIIRQRLDVTRRKSGDFQPVKLNIILSGLLDFLKIKMEKSAIRLKTSLQELTVIGDEDQLQQIFINIFLNALEAMDSNGTLTVGVQTQTKNNMPFAEVRIQDTGPGISHDHLSLIFDPFFSTKKDQGGTGLGLSVVKEIVKRHGGEIQVESEPLQGATFIVLLPLRLDV